MLLKFIGGASTVTGSCYYLEVNDLRILVECGMRQGNRNGALDRAPFPFDPAGLDFIFVTHAHMDHSGLLPKAVKEGFRGRIIATGATIDLLGPMLYDSASVQASDAEWSSRKEVRAGRAPVEPAYTAGDVAAALSLTEARPYGGLFHLGSGVKYRFIDAGHILGSASLELWFQDSAVEKKIIFSGDIGKKGNPIVRDPSPPGEADYLVMESTYGNRTHRPLKESIDELAGVIKSTFKRGGNVYIPSFAVGRAQDVLYILNNLAREGRIYRANVYLDSPLAEEATKVYLAHPECYDEEARRFFSTGSTDSAIRLHFVRTAEESMRLNNLGPCNIVIAGSGMCEGGRIRHHLKHNLWKPASSVVFVGYQAEGTLGRKIVDGIKSVNVLGEEVAVRASVHTINGFSAHADRAELLGWLSSFRNKPKVFIVHGEADAAESLAGAVREEYSYEAVRHRDGDTYNL